MAKNGAWNCEITGESQISATEGIYFPSKSASFYQQASLETSLSLSNCSMETKTQRATMAGNEELFQVIPTKFG